MGLVRSVYYDAPMIAAGLLHDVVVDTQVTIEEIEAEFGREVAGLVAWVADVSTPADGNKAARKAIDRDHLALAPAERKRSRSLI